MPFAPCAMHFRRKLKHRGREMIDIAKKDYLPDFVSKMKKENLADVVIETFRHYYNQALKGETGLLLEVNWL